MIPEHAQRTLALEAPGGPAQRLAIVAPSIARPGEPFAVKLAALDCMGYPSVECDGAAEPIAGPAEGLTQPVRFEHGKPAVGGIGGLTLGEARAQSPRIATGQSMSSGTTGSLPTTTASG